jgi:hypothetical protein
MNAVRPVSFFATASTIWRRAPAWRMLVLTASLATLLFILFGRPSRAAHRESLAALEKATYASMAAASPPPASAIAATVPAVPPAAIAKVAAAPASVAAPALPPPALAPRTATLAMVTANPDTKDDPSGLDPALRGRAYTGVARINGYDVPLPEGDWITLANSTVNLPTAGGETFFLGQVRNKRLVGALRIFAIRSKSLPGDGFNEAKSCSEINPYRIASVIDEPLVPHGHQACWTIRNVYSEGFSRWGDRAAHMSSLDRAAGGDMAAKGVTYPQDMISLTFTRTETWGLLEVGYLFSPEAAGIHSTTVLSVSDSDWTAQNLAHEGDKAAYIDKLKAWGDAQWPRFKAAFAKGMPANLPAVQAERAASAP